MISLKTVIDEVVDKVFNNEEKTILTIHSYESSDTGTQSVILPVGKQFLHYYKNSYYDGTIDELVIDMLNIKAANQDLLYKIGDIKENILNFLNPRKYSTVNSGWVNSKVNAINLTSTATTSDTVGNNYELTNIDESNYSSSGTLSQAGSSQTNKTNLISSILIDANPKLLKKKERKIDINTETNKATVTQVDPTNVTDDKPLNIADPNKQINYQQLNFELSNNSEHNLSDTETTTVSGDKGVKKDKGTNVSILDNSIGKDLLRVKSNENEARLKAWTTELPRLRHNFFHVFQDLFCREWYY